MNSLNIEYSPNKHIPALDCIRGLAVLLIILFHFFDFVIFKFGWVGVDLFFVLSGFLITGILLDSKSATYYYRNFIVRRILRIFPLYYFVLLISLIVVPLVWPMLFGGGFEYYTHNQLYFWLYMQNWLYSNTGFPKNPTLIHFWSLAVEEQFYIFWPFIVGVFSARRLFIVSLIIIVLSLFFRLWIGPKLGLIHPYEYMATFSRMDALSVGAIIAILIRKRPAWLEKYTFPVFMVSLVALLATMLILRAVLFLRLAPVYTLIDILAGCLLIFMLNRRKFFILRPLYHPVFSFLGKYSYGIYIYHYLVFRIMEYHFLPKLALFSGTREITLIINGIIAFAISILISILSYRFIEQPFLKLKKFFSNSIKE